MILLAFPLSVLLQGALTEFLNIKIPVILDVDKSPLAPFLKFIFPIFLNPIFLVTWALLWWYKLARFEFPDLTRPDVRPNFMLWVNILFIVSAILIVSAIFYFVR
jgi:hypothetical protein